MGYLLTADAIDRPVLSMTRETSYTMVSIVRL